MDVLPMGVHVPRKASKQYEGKNDPWFVEYLLRVGGGTEDTNSDGDICLPDEVCVPYSGSDSDLDKLIEFVFPNLNENMSDSTYITSRAILSTRNDWVDMINAKMIDRFQGEHMVTIVSIAPWMIPITTTHLSSYA